METKKEFRWFTINQHEKEEAYLRRQHQNGWRFERVCGFGVYHFTRCEPEDVVYQLDYHDDARKNRTEYLGMFRDCGWEHLQDYAGYSYFRKPAAEMQGEERIFSDEDSKIAMMRRVYKGRLRPLLVLFCCFLIPQFVLQISLGNYGVAALYAGILALYVTVFVIFGIRYRKLRDGK